MKTLSKSNLRYFTFLTLLALVTFAFLGMISSFLLVVFWSTALSIIFWGINKKITAKVGGKENLGAMLTTVFILLGVVIPFALIAAALVVQSEQVYSEIQSGDFRAHQLMDILLDKVPFLGSLLERFQIDFDSIRTTINASASKLAGTIANQIVNYTQNILGLFVDFFMMIYLLFFFLRDGKQIVKAIGDVFPLSSDIEETLFYRFASVTRATLRGTLIVAIIQGFIGGVLFALVGIQAAVLWGVLMTLLALLPVGGSAIVWMPASIILFMEGQTGKAIIVVLVGALIIGLIDNLLRPQLVGRETQMPDYLILLSTLGGIAWVGLAGFVIGPIVAALFITCWEIMGKEIVEA